MTGRSIPRRADTTDAILSPLCAMDDVHPTPSIVIDGNDARTTTADTTTSPASFNDHCRLSEAINFSIDQAALTGESLPQTKKDGDQCFS